MPSSRAISAIGRPLLQTSSTASRLNSAVNWRRFLGCLSSMRTSSAQGRCPASGRKSNRALLAVVMEAYVHGTSTRKVDDLVKALGVDAGISKSEVSRICGELDGEVAAFRSRSLAHTAFPYAFLRSLKARGLAGVQLVVSDAHTGLKQAVAAVMAGAAWQRCRVHFLRNVLARVPKGSAEMVAAAIRTIFAQPTGAEVIEQLDKV